ncbi:hypothetical protein AB0H49_33350 [Nocardia sp. NPDC050713]|uniref:hypothetical protein n=1 Tax=Nocardia sp. NPDC050713 TaxID=3154511 RepID=UPI0033F43FD6
MNMIAVLRRVLAVVAVVGSTAAPMALTPPAQAGPLTDCGWSRRIGADTLNVALPDTFANYWMAAVPGLPAEGLTLRGRYPHGRYISFTSYQGSRTLDGLDDLRIDPDPGSVNPFRPGADRAATERSFTVRVLPGPRPERPAPNTLYADSGVALIIYRVYRVDEGRDPLGGEPLPEITVHGADGPRALPACTTAKGAIDTSSARLSGGQQLPPGVPGPDYRVWSKTSGDGVFANPDNTYLASHVAPRAGQVAVVRAKLPTTPGTYRGQATMTLAQLRYWSMCSNELATTRVSACVVDDETPVDERGWFTVVVSDRADRPANATRYCGVAWLPTAGLTTTLLMRNMLPDTVFAHSIQRAPEDDPAAGMGDYYPRTELRTTAEFEGIGCGN